MKRVGTRDEVFNGNALQTRGGIQKNGLMLNKYNKIVSKRRHLLGVSQGARQLKNYRASKPSKSSEHFFYKKENHTFQSGTQTK